MAFVDWDDRYSVHDIVADQWHRELFDIVNDLHNAILAKRGKDELAGLLGRLKQHAHSHFSAEEELLRRTNYPSLDEHVREHHALVGGIANLEQRMHAGERSVPIDTLHILVRDWLLTHILTHDKQYATHIQKQYQVMH